MTSKYLILTRPLKYSAQEPLFSTFGGIKNNSNDDFEIIAFFDSLELAQDFNSNYKASYEEYKGIIEFTIDDYNWSFIKSNLSNNIPVVKLRLYEITFFKEPYPSIITHSIKDITYNVASFNEEFTSITTRNLSVKVFAKDISEALKIANFKMVNQLIKGLG